MAAWHRFTKMAENVRSPRVQLSNVEPQWETFRSFTRVRDTKAVYRQALLATSKDEFEQLKNQAEPIEKKRRLSLMRELRSAQKWLAIRRFELIVGCMLSCYAASCRGRFTKEGFSNGVQGQTKREIHRFLRGFVHSMRDFVGQKFALRKASIIRRGWKIIMFLRKLKEELKNIAFGCPGPDDYPSKACCVYLSNNIPLLRWIPAAPDGDLCLSR